MILTLYTISKIRCLSGLNLTLKMIHRLVSWPEIQVVKVFLAVPDSAFLKRRDEKLMLCSTSGLRRQARAKRRSVNRRSQLTAPQISHPRRVKSVTTFATFATFATSYTSKMLTWKLHGLLFCSVMSSVSHEWPQLTS